jgi:predicted Zn finger-like uncharacterized protein
MFTTCPACQTVFRLTAATLRAAHGQVVCATCHTTFDALFGLSDEPPAGATGLMRSLTPPVVEAPPEPEAEPAPAPQPEPTAADPELDDLPANPSLDQVAAALADAGVLLEELDDPSALDEVTLLHIPGDPRHGLPSGPPLVAQALADDVARQQRRDAPQAPAPAWSGTQVELDDDDPTGTWAPLPAAAVAAAMAAPEPEPEPELEPEPKASPEPEQPSFAATLQAVSAQPATNLQGEPLTETGTATSTEADAEEALEPWMDDAQPRPRAWAWTLGSIALLVVLAGQALHHWRDSLARHPTLGPAVVSLYAALGQPLAPELHLLAYTVTQGRVDAAPEPGALRVSAVITNRTGSTHPRPLLQVTLEDRYGAPIGRRAFHPEEYATGPAIAMPPHGELPVAVEVADPGNEAVGFKLDICIEAEGVLHCASDPVDGFSSSEP